MWILRIWKEAENRREENDGYKEICRFETLEEAEIYANLFHSEDAVSFLFDHTNNPMFCED